MTHDARDNGSFVRQRRDAILGAAADAMARARARRVRRARILSAACVAALLSGVVASISRTTATPRDEPTLAIDFAIERTTRRSIDFVAVRARSTDDAAGDAAGIGANGGTPTLAIDFASVASMPAAPARRVDLLTDAEAEAALAESGLCVRILRVEGRPLLVDCRTGAPAAIR